MISTVNSSTTASNTINPMPPASSSIIPLANRLGKLTTLPFGRTKWQTRFFILLDSELRMYKDEFADIPSDILSLHHIKTIIPLTIGPQTHCLRLEPHLPHDKAFTLACPSQHDRDVWSNAIHIRLEKRTRDTQQLTDASKASPPSLTRRRGIMLAPLTISTKSGPVTSNRHDDEVDEITITGVPGIAFSSSSTSASSAYSICSPPPPPSYVYERSMSVPTVTTSTFSSSQQQRDGETSPSFLKYKQQFRLY